MVGYGCLGKGREGLAHHGGFGISRRDKCQLGIDIYEGSFVYSFLKCET